MFATCKARTAVGLTRSIVPAVWIALSATLGGCLTDPSEPGETVSTPHEPDLLAVVVDSSPDSLNASWKVYDLSGVQKGQGSADASVEVDEAGVYIVRWDGVAGWTTPPQVRTPVTAGTPGQARGVYVRR